MTEITDSPILMHADKVRTAMLARDKVLLNRITKDYLAAYKSLKLRIDAAAKALAAAGLEPTFGQQARVVALQMLLEGVQDETTQFARILGDNIEAAVRYEIAQAGIDTTSYMSLSFPAEYAKLTVEAWPQIAPEQVYRMFGFLDPSGPLYSGLEYSFGADAAEKVRQALMTGFTSGMNPRSTARLIQAALGQPLNWALQAARTASLWAYRAASSANYQAHSDVIKGWTWFANLGDPRTCPGCVAQHGSFHPVTETLADHHQGRCLVPGTAVQIDGGLVMYIQYIVIGDHVFTHEGRYKKVLDVFSRMYTGEVLTIQNYSGSVTVTPEHKIWTLRGWVEAKDIGEGDGYSIVRRSTYSGTVYDLEVEDDHSYMADGVFVHNCTMLPVTRSWAELGIEGVQEGPDLSVLNDEQRQRLALTQITGEQWFNSLPADQQRQILGAARYAAWQDGAFNFRDLSRPYTDKVYGQMWGAASLQQLVGKELADKYKRLGRV